MRQIRTELGNGKRSRKTHRTNGQDHREETDEKRTVKGEGGEISIDTPRARHPLDLSVDP